MIYPEAVSYLNSFVDYERKKKFSYKAALKLTRIKLFLEQLGNPQDRLKCIHLAGTKGKGTTAVFVAYMLREAGYRVGLYTSPHLNDFRERIRILYPLRRYTERKAAEDFEGLISKRSICKLVLELKPGIDRFNRSSKYGPLTFFEVYTAVAFLYFVREKTDFVVLETGLGGRLDATNTVNPLVVGITPISLEHTALLGRCITDIAKEKTGIIKVKDSIVLSAKQENVAGKIIRQRCKHIGAELYEIGKEITLSKISSDLSGTNFSAKTTFGIYSNLKIKLIGHHQAFNALLALGIIESLRLYNIAVSKTAIRRGLARAVWPGRFEILKKRPFIILDGAQNKASSLALAKIIKGIFRNKIILVLGVSSDKDIQGILKILLVLAKKVIFTKSSNPRARPADNIRRRSLKIKKMDIQTTQSIPEALELARRQAKKTDVIIVTGSLFVVGEAREVLLKK